LQKGVKKKLLVDLQYRERAPFSSRAQIRVFSQTVYQKSREWLAKLDLHFKTLLLIQNK